MHSYAATNFELRKEYLNSSANSSSHSSISPHVYPNNLSFSNYVYYLRVPCFVYETEYPLSKEGFRVRYFLMKFFFVVLLFVFLYLMASDRWVPLCTDFASGKLGSVLEFYTRSVCPFGIMSFTLFLVVFEYVCNCYAELTRFGDRLFYQDFWNCTSYDEFGRKWNRIVHEFLYRHMYLVSLKLGLTTAQGYIVTLVYSAIMHEYFMICTLGIIRPYITILMISQAFVNFVFAAILRIRKVLE